MTKPFDPFRSERLLYRAIEDGPADSRFFTAVQRDAAAQSGSSFGVPVPESVKSSNAWKDGVVQNALLGVVVCLRPSSTASGDKGEDGAAAEVKRERREEEENPVPVGVLVLKGNKPSTAHHRHSYISIDILAAHRGKGYGSEAIEWALGWGFQMAGLHRVGIEAFSYNAGAMRLYERLGFVCEGRRREELWFDGGWWDFVTYGMLEGEWRARVERTGRSWWC